MQFKKARNQYKYCNHPVLSFNFQVDELEKKKKNNAFPRR